MKFYLLLFSISIPFWIIGSMADNGLPLPMNLPVSALMFVCPLIVALILVYRKDRINGICLLFKKVFDTKKIKNKVWYVPSIFLMPIIMLLSYGVMILMGIPLPKIQIPFLTITIFFVIFFISAVGEEAGWMGYAFELTQDRWSALKSSVIMGAVWAIWHAIPYIQAHNSLKWIVWQSIFSIAARVLIVWLYNNTGKSVLPGILFHSMINVSWSLFPNYGSHYDPAITGSITVIIAVMITFLWGARTLDRYRFA
jgi:membrane protease YdiL (CAAX protease family)